MIADVLAIVDLGPTDASFVSLAQHFADAQKARLRIAVVTSWSKAAEWSSAGQPTT